MIFFEHASKAAHTKQSAAYTDFKRFLYVEVSTARITKLVSIVMSGHVVHIYVRDGWPIFCMGIAVGVCMYVP